VLLGALPKSTLYAVNQQPLCRQNSAFHHDCRYCFDKPLHVAVTDNNVVTVLNSELNKICRDKSLIRKLPANKAFKFIGTLIDWYKTKPLPPCASSEYARNGCGARAARLY